MKNVETKLKTLLDYQRFQGNPKLHSIISDVEARYGNALSDEDLSMVNAAGELPELECGNLLWNAEDMTK